MKHAISVKWIAVVLAVLLLLPTLAACGDSTGADNETTAAPTTTAPSGETAPAETEAPSDEDMLGFPPEDNKGETFTILSSSFRDYEFNTDNVTGDVVNDAVFKKDQLLEEYLGIELNIVLENGNWPTRNEFNALISNAVNSNDQSYDLVNNMIVCTMPAATSGIFLDGKVLPNVNFDQPWWVADMYENYAVSGKLYGFLGDASLSLYKDMSVIYFNKDIWADLKPDVNLYDLVRNGEWTLERFLNECSDMAIDLDGDGKYTPGADRLSFAGDQVPLGTFQTALQIKVVEPNSEDVPTFLGLTERYETAYTKLRAFNTETDGNYAYPSTDTSREQLYNDFASGLAATMCTFIYATESLRNMDNDYGIIPIPKYDENQESYYSQLGTSTSALFVPKNVRDPELTSKVMECLAYFGYTYVTPKYYEVALKTKYASDEDMQEMLDLIRETATFDFIFAYGSSLSSAPNGDFRFTQVQENLASAFKTTERVFNASLKKFVEAYASHD